MDVGNEKDGNSVTALFNWDPIFARNPLHDLLLALPHHQGSNRKVDKVARKSRRQQQKKSRKKNRGKK